MKTNRSQELLARVTERLAVESDIVLAIAFGSAASGKLRQASDVDIAILLRDPMTVERRRELMTLIADIAGRPVDLVDLRTSGVVVTRAALTQGKRLICKDRAALASLLSRTLLDVADFLPYRQRILAERRETWIR
jgi:predicted nucleotidyltransferase